MESNARVLDDLDLHHVSVVEEPVNPGATFEESYWWGGHTFVPLDEEDE